MSTQYLEHGLRRIGIPDFLRLALDERKSRHAIREAIAEYKKSPLTPELVDTTWQTLWGEWGKRVRGTFDVPSCDRTPEELAQLQKENKAVLLIPDNLDLVMLGNMFPEMKRRAIQAETTVTDEQSTGGCVDIEMDIESPHGNTTEDQAIESLKLQGRNGQRLKTYFIGSEFSKALTGHGFDNNTFSRLPGSRSKYIYDREDRMMYAPFFTIGHVPHDVLLFPHDHQPHIGFRSEGVKKA